MNPLIEEIYRTKQCEDVDGNSIDPFALAAPVPYSDGMILYQIIRDTKATKTLEIGFAYGLSTLFMCQGLVDNGGGHHVAIDPVESTVWKSVGLVNIRKAGFDNMVTFHEACSHDVLPKLLGEGEKFDLVFIDGFHVFDAVLLDFYYSDRLIECGSYIMIHDVWMPAIRKALGFILRNRHYRLESQFMPGPQRFALWFRRFLKDLWHNPYDLYSSGFMRQDYFRCPFVVLQKISDDDRLWNHYQCF
jgi:predicted O-methyltransferase YrrM